MWYKKMQVCLWFLRRERTQKVSTVAKGEKIVKIGRVFPFYTPLPRLTLSLERSSGSEPHGYG